MRTGKNGKMTAQDMLRWCREHIRSGEWNDPYVLVPLDGLKALVNSFEPKAPVPLHELLEEEERRMAELRTERFVNE